MDCQLNLGTDSYKKKRILSGIARITSPPPLPGQLVPPFLDVKNDVLARITEQSKDDYDNDVSDNCDHNFGTLDDFGVKNAQKVSHNMILRWKKGLKKFGQGPPPPFCAMPERKHSFLQEMFNNP